MPPAKTKDKNSKTFEFARKSRNHRKDFTKIAREEGIDEKTDYLMLEPKPSLKIGSVNKAFLF
jgi:hypothetical protein